jgi:mRNA interferase RelE/StbE
VPRLVFARSARRELLSFDAILADAVEDALGELAADPELGHPLRGRLRGLRSMRVGAYRVIYQLVENGRTVRVAAIRHRAAAYRADPR